MRKHGGRRAKMMGDRAAEGLEELIGSAEDLLQSLQDEQGEAVEKLRGKVSATVKAASSQLESLGNTASGIGRSNARSSVKFMRRDPWRAIAIAAVMVLGFTVLMRHADD